MLKCFQFFSKFQIVDLIEFFLFFCEKSFAHISKTTGWIFTKFKMSIGTYKPLDVECTFIFESGHKMSSDGHLEIVEKICTG